MTLCYVAIDIGATWIRIAIADSDGKFLGKCKIRTLARGSPREFMENIISALKRMLSSENINEIYGIGIGSIGPLDIRRGVILKSPNIQIRDIPIVDFLQKKLGAPTYIVNDCTAGVIGEKFFGLGKKTDNLVYVTLSSGIGGGAIVDGNVLFGKDGNAVEIGHFVVDMERRLKCGCGGYGHWEAYTSGANIRKYVKLLILEKYGVDAYRESMLSKTPMDQISYEVLIECAKNMDHLALDVLNNVGRINAIGLANVINAFDPELITIGGSIALKNPKELIFEPILRNLDEYVINRVPRIKITELGEDIILYGALAIAMHPEIIPESLRKKNK